MTVSELIAKLQAMPEDAVVVVRGKEGGYDDIDDVKALDIVLNPIITKGEIKKDEHGDDSDWRTGVYEEPEIISLYEELTSTPFSAVYIKEYDERCKHSEKRKRI